MTDKKLDLISNRCKTLLYCKKFPHILDTENRAYAYERVLEDFRADLKDEFGNEKDELTALNFIDELVVNDVDVGASVNAFVQPGHYGYGYGYRYGYGGYRAHNGGYHPYAPATEPKGSAEEAAVADDAPGRGGAGPDLADED